MTSTEIILDHHLDCFSKGDLKGLLSDYTENTVLETPTGQITGLKTLRKLGTRLRWSGAQVDRRVDVLRIGR